MHIWTSKDIQMDFRLFSSFFLIFLACCTEMGFKIRFLRAFYSRLHVKKYIVTHHKNKVFLLSHHPLNRSIFIRQTERPGITQLLEKLSGPGTSSENLLLKPIFLMCTVDRGFKNICHQALPAYKQKSDFIKSDTLTCSMNWNNIGGLKLNAPASRFKRVFFADLLKLDRLFKKQTGGKPYPGSDKVWNHALLRSQAFSMLIL